MPLTSLDFIKILTTSESNEALKKYQMDSIGVISINT